jgi:hypothetical protein
MRNHHFAKTSGRVPPESREYQTTPQPFHEYEHPNDRSAYLVVPIRGFFCISSCGTPELVLQNTLSSLPLITLESFRLPALFHPLIVIP